jgi:hypothetical protein
MRPELGRGDRGEAVARLQALLTKTGAILVADGEFGPATERAVREARAEAGLPPGDRADEAMWSWLDAAPEPSPDLPAEAVAFIVRHEISSRAHYDARLQAPAYPGAESGLTIGIGYDLRFSDPARLQDDWGSELPGPVLARLRPWLGRRADARAVSGLADLRVPFGAAWRVFCRASLPRAVAEARAAYPALDGLPPLCRGALVSLVYNRGGRLTDRPGRDSRREMAEIRRLLDAGGPADLAAVPARIEAMKRLWPTLAGLRARRDEEAAMFRRGLGEG